MKRSDRHKTDKQTQNQDQEQTKHNQQTNDNNAFSKYVSKDKLEQGKKFFRGKLTAYNSQLQKENKILKEKFTNLRTGNARQEKDPERKRPIIPIIVTGILLLPITILLAFLLITNFLPDESDMNRIASSETEEADVDNSEETDEDTETTDSETEDAEADETDTPEDTEIADGEDTEESDVDEELPEQVSEPEIATTADYSSAKRQQLQRAAQNAVNEKNAELAHRREQEALARARQAEEEAKRQAEASNETENNPDETEQTEDTENAETPTAGGATHTVTAEDNLYRIAIQYYGDGSAANVQRIREANGLSGDNLELGQQLTIP